MARKSERAAESAGAHRSGGNSGGDVPTTPHIARAPDSVSDLLGDNAAFWGLTPTMCRNFGRVYM
jgi:hypothetical protein